MSGLYFYNGVDIFNNNLFFDSASSATTVKNCFNNFNLQTTSTTNDIDKTKLQISCENTGFLIDINGTKNDISYYTIFNYITITASQNLAIPSGCKQISYILIGSGGTGNNGNITNTSTHKSGNTGTNGNGGQVLYGTFSTNSSFPNIYFDIGISQQGNSQGTRLLYGNQLGPTDITAYGGTSSTPGIKTTNVNNILISSNSSLLNYGLGGSGGNGGIYNNTNRTSTSPNAGLPGTNGVARIYYLF